MIQWSYLGDANLDALNEEQRRFLEQLITALCLVRISFLCPESLEEFVRRSNAQCFEDPITEQDVRPFIGLRVSVTTWSSFTWAVNNMGVVDIDNFQPDISQPGNLHRKIMGLVNECVQKHSLAAVLEMFASELKDLLDEHHRGINELPIGTDVYNANWATSIDRVGERYAGSLSANR